LAVSEIECDELWGFIGMKEKTRQRLNRPENFGDCYTFLAIERNTKLIVAFHIGKRTSDDCWQFAARLYEATAGRFQVSTDGYGPYQSAIPLTFKFGIDFAQLIKRFGETDIQDQRRYSPAQITSVDKTIGCGNPDMDRVCTSHSERLNLSLRMQIRRMTRLTNGHSKTLKHHKAMLALYFAWYNFVRRHMTLKTTPAVAHGLTDHEWTIEELLTAAARASRAH
jgi:IS1 family transposase